MELRADERALAILKNPFQRLNKIGKRNFDFILAVKVVDSLDEAIQHINRYNTKHSESIISDNYFATQQFLQQVDAAAVYANASTRFTDGFEFDLAPKSALVRKITCPWTYGLSRAYFDKICYLWKWARRS